MGKRPTINLIVATAEEASGGVADPRVDNGTGAALHNIDSEGIRELHCVIMRYDEDPGVLGRHRRVYTWTESHGPWLQECPAEFVAALAAIPPDRFREIGFRWWERLWRDDDEDVRAEMMVGAPVDSLGQEVGVLVAFARSAIRDGKNLYWVVPGC